MTRQDRPHPPVAAPAASPLPLTRAPGPRGLEYAATLGWILGTRNLAGVCAHLQARYGDVVRIRLGASTVYLLSKPEYVQRVLLDNNRNYTRGRTHEEMEFVLGKGLLTSEGELWRRQRRLCQPSFDKASLAGFVPVMVRSVAAMVDRWGRAAATGEPIELGDEMTRETLAVVGRCLFGIDLSDGADTIGASLGASMEYVFARLKATFRAPASLPTPARRRARRAVEAFDDAVMDVIRGRKRAAAPGEDLLGHLLTAHDDDRDAAMSERQLRDELATFVAAGHETTGNALTFLWILLGRHPDVADEVHREVTRVLGSRAPSAEDLPRLEYTRMVVEEGLRMYPTAWSIERVAVGDDAMGGHGIPAGSRVLLSPFVTHRHPDSWRAPGVFDPSRFSPEAKASRHRFAYFPFGGGPRQCIGAAFAIMEMQVFVALVVRRFRLELTPDAPLDLDAAITLRPRRVFRATLVERAHPG